jgi:uncharacterized protein YneF (UPF0154 family)
LEPAEFEILIIDSLICNPGFAVKFVNSRLFSDKLWQKSPNLTKNNIKIFFSKMSQNDQN